MNRALRWLGVGCSRWSPFQPNYHSNPPTWNLHLIKKTRVRIPQLYEGLAALHSSIKQHVTMALKCLIRGRSSAQTFRLHPIPRPRRLHAHRPEICSISSFRNGLLSRPYNHAPLSPSIPSAKFNVGCMTIYNQFINLCIIIIFIKLMVKISNILNSWH